MKFEYDNNEKLLRTKYRVPSVEFSRQQMMSTNSILPSERIGRILVTSNLYCTLRNNIFISPTLFKKVRQQFMSQFGLLLQLFFNCIKYLFTIIVLYTISTHICLDVWGSKIEKYQKPFTNTAVFSFVTC